MCVPLWKIRTLITLMNTETTDAEHGRIEERSYRAYDVPQYLNDIHSWPHLKAFVHVVSRREAGDNLSRSERL